MGQVIGWGLLAKEKKRRRSWGAFDEAKGEREKKKQAHAKLNTIIIADHDDDDGDHTHTCILSLSPGSLLSLSFCVCPFILIKRGEPPFSSSSRQEKPWSCPGLGKGEKGRNGFDLTRSESITRLVGPCPTHHTTPSLASWYQSLSLSWI